jgi:hypothetical protein
VLWVEDLCYGLRAVLDAGSVFHIAAPLEETSECWHPVHVPDDTWTYRWACWIQKSLQKKLHNAVPFNDAYTQVFLIEVPRVEKHDSAYQGELNAKVFGLSALCKNWKRNFRREIMNTSWMELRRVWNTVFFDI